MGEENRVEIHSGVLLSIKNDLPETDGAGDHRIK